MIVIELLMIHGLIWLQLKDRKVQKECQLYRKIGLVDLIWEEVTIQIFNLETHQKVKVHQFII